MKSKIFIVLLVLTGANFTYSQANGSRYIGYKYTDVTALANGVKVVGGWDIGDPHSSPAYGIASVEKGKTDMLWLIVSMEMESTGLLGWKVLDVLSFPVTAKGEVMFVHPAGSPNSCTRFGKVIPYAAGVGRIVRNQSVFRPLKVWVPDLAIKKFKSIPVSGIKCE